MWLRINLGLFDVEKLYRSHSYPYYHKDLFIIYIQTWATGDKTIDWFVYSCVKYKKYKWNVNLPRSLFDQVVVENEEDDKLQSVHAFTYARAEGQY